MFILPFVPGSANVCHMAIRFEPVNPPRQSPPKAKGKLGNFAPRAMPPPEPEPAEPRRAIYLAGQTTARLKPWIAQGISQRTWYRREKERKKEAEKPRKSRKSLKHL